MTSALLSLMVLLPQDTGSVYRGSAGEISVQPPRIEATATVDGVLDEPVWQRAARLTGFSQFQPVDGRPAEEPTEVLVWYAPDAIWFGIRATEVHGDVVRATRANRDNIGSEDHVQILLDTNNDRRLAFLFGANALGVQQDGTRSDQFGGGAGGGSTTGGGIGTGNFLDGNTDLNPDFIFESRGRLVADGYEVEIRIPFKSLRYQEAQVQTWGIQVLRRIQHSGFQDTWAPAVRGNASFLGQSGALEGLRDIRRGLLLEITPTSTARADGAPDGHGGYDYDTAQEFSGDVRWGIRQSLTLNATANPDFSQVEADVGQVVLNERFALFFPDKRPFFLDGLELFDTPNRLIHTRRVVNPDVGVKVAGKLGRTNIAALTAIDSDNQSWNGSSTPVFGIVRLRSDIGRNSTLGGITTVREDGPDHSRLVGADVRLYHDDLYFVEVQAVQAWTDSAGVSSNGPLFDVTWDRTGRSWGFNHSFKAIAPGFRAASGFVNRTGFLEGRFSNRLTGYGGPDALVQTYGAFFTFSRLWDYDSPGDGAIEGGESVSPSMTLRGGWQFGGSVSRNFFSFEPGNFQGVTVLRNGIEVPFTVPGQERNQWGGSLRVTTPTFRQFTATANVSLGRTPIFREAAPGRSSRVDVVVDLRPTSALRGALQFTRLTLDRRTDGSRFSTETIPRLKLEYQMTRSVFVRFIGQYTAQSRSALRDREGSPILVGGVADTGSVSNEFRMDWLFSYRPTPGTLLTLGYGATLEEAQEFRFRDLQRTRDGFFGKVSYLFRM